MTQYTVIYPPTISWGEPIFQRPHQLQMEFARQGHFAILANAVNDGKGIHWYPEDKLCITNNLNECLKQKDVIDQMAGTKKVFWVTFPGTMRFYDAVNPDILVFDYIDECVDEFSHWLGGIYECMDKAELVVVTSDRLYEILEEKYAHKMLLARNGADIRQYFIEPKFVPLDMKPARQKHETIVGFHGSLQSWVDYDIIIEMAQKRPEWGFVMVGPEYYSGSKKLHGYDNIYLLGAKRYTELNPYVHNFDVGIIPFQLRDMTQSSNPIKMYEYLAAGVPVIATPLRECVNLNPYVRTGSTADDFIALTEDALAKKAQEVQKYKEIAFENSWTKRVEDIVKALGKLS